MLPKLRTGVSLDDQTVATLKNVWDGLANVRGASGLVGIALGEAYQRWVDASIHQLAFTLTDDEMGHLVRTPGYYALAGVPVTNAVEAALRTEVNTLWRRWETLVTECTKYRARWRGSAELVVPDTNVWMEHKDRFDSLDWRATAKGLPPDAAVRVVLLMPVFDELDGLKKSLGNDIVKKTRLRETMRLFRTYFERPSYRSRLVDRNDRAIEFGTTIELVLDDADNVRLPIMDNEIVKQAQLLGSRTALPVRIITGDLRMCVTARAEGMKVDFLDYDENKATAAASPPAAP